MRAQLVGMLAIVGALTGYFVSVSMPHRFVAHSVLKVLRPANLTKENYDEDSHRMAEAVATEVLSPEMLLGMINRESRLRELLATEPLPELSDRIRAGSKIYATKLPGGVNAIAVDFEDDEAEPAINVNRALTSLAGKVATAAAHYREKGDATETVAPPMAEPTGATLPLCIGLGFAGGLAMGLVLAAFAKSEPISAT